MSLRSRHGQWVDARLERDARRSSGALFVREWLLAAFLWAGARTMVRLILAPAGEPHPLGTWALDDLLVGLLFFGPLMAAWRVHQVARWRRKRTAGPEPDRAT